MLLTLNSFFVCLNLFESRSEKNRNSEYSHASGKSLFSTAIIYFSVFSYIKKAPRRQLANVTELTDVKEVRLCYKKYYLSLSFDEIRQ